MTCPAKPSFFNGIDETFDEIIGNAYVHSAGSCLHSNAFTKYLYFASVVSKSVSSSPPVSRQSPTAGLNKGLT